MSHYQDAEQNTNIKTTKKSFKNVSNFKYLGMDIRNSNFINEEITNLIQGMLATFQF